MTDSVDLKRVNAAAARLSVEQLRMVADLAEYLANTPSVDIGALGSVDTPPERIVAVTGESATEGYPNWPVKDPDEVLDYGIDWAPRMANDTIAGSEWIDRGKLGIFLVWQHQTDTRCWIKNGEPGKTYFVTNRVVTAKGRVMDQTVTLTIAKAR